MPDALDLLRQDHNEVKELFRNFESTDDKQQKYDIARRAILMLKVHSLIEEELFYPAVREDTDAEEETMDEANEEHHVADLLIEELESMNARTERFSAKFTVLAENVKHHIGEEESEIFPKAAEAGRELLNELGEQMQVRKVQLMEEMQRPSRARTAGRSSAHGRAPSGRTSGARPRTAGGPRAGARSGARSTTASRSGSGARASSGTRSGSTGTRPASRAGGATSRSSTTAAGATGRRTTAAGSSRSGAMKSGTSRSRAASKSTGSRAGAASSARRRTAATTSRSGSGGASRKTTSSRSRSR